MSRPPASVYRDDLTPSEHRRFLRARREGANLDEEIALLRTRIASLAAVTDPANPDDGPDWLAARPLEANRLLCRMLETLSALVRTQHLLGNATDDLTDTIADFNKRFLEQQRERSA